NPGVIADCTGDNAGDSVGPTADGFETYGVTGVALISFILLAIRVANADGTVNAAATDAIRAQLLTWIFMLPVLMIATSVGAYLLNERLAESQHANADKMNFEHPLTVLVWLTSGISIVLTYIASWFIIGNVNGDTTLWWKLSTIISCGTIAGAVIPEL